MSPLRSRAGYVIGALSLFALLALLLAGCETDTPQNTFDARGEVARDERDLFYLAMWPAIGVMVLVEGLLIIMLLRFRRRRADEVPKQTHGNTRLEIAWTIVPAVLILGTVGIPMIPAIFHVSRTPAADALPVKVIGRQWVWEFEYPDYLDSEGKPVSSRGELHVPVGREIGLTLTSEDVIHSFWVPKLAGKVDVIPGQENEMWLRADEPASYSGQCAEFCGLGHAEMRVTLIAQSQEDFDAWVREEREG